MPMEPLMNRTGKGLRDCTKKYSLLGQDGDGHRQGDAEKARRIYAYMEKARLIDRNRRMGKT